MALQHLRSSTADKRPTPAAMSDGQLAMNTNLVSPGLFLKDSNGDLVKVGPVHVGTTAPNATPGAGGQAGNSKGEQWLDTSSSRYVFKIWDGTAWRTEDGEFVNVSGDTMTGALGIIAGTAAAPGVFFSGDTNTGIYSPGADQLAVATNGTGRLFVDASGRVGVGTGSAARAAILTTKAANQSIASGNGLLSVITSDSQAANVGGSIVLGGQSTDADWVYASLSGRSENNSYAGYLAFGTSASGGQHNERLRITSAGLVGIGTSAPNYQLHVTTDFAVGASGFNQQLTFNNDTIQSLLLGTGYTALKLNPLGGNVGIGTTSPSGKLEVSAGNSEGLRLSSSSYLSSSQGPWIAFNGGPSAGWDLARVQGIRTGSNAEGALVFYTNNGGGAPGTISEKARLNESGRLLVGTSSTSGDAKLLVQGNTSNNVGWLDLALNATTTASGTTLAGIRFKDSSNSEYASISSWIDNTGGTNDYPGRLVFSVTADGASSPTERMRIASNGDIGIAKTALDDNVSGIYLQATGTIRCSRNDSLAVFNRLVNDGTLIEFLQGGAAEGSISVSGTTVSYNGAHLSRWSQLPDGAERTEILRGTVLSNIDEMCEWGNEDNEQLNRMKVSDVEGDKNVSGVFQAWDDDDDTYTNDFYCAMTGDFIIRIAEGVTVERGDLLMSAGDGTAKPQGDGYVQDKTIAKVTSTNVSCTYDDGSYCVPCVLMAC